MPENPDAIVYQRIGEDGFERLATAFYNRVATDDILRPMYPESDLEPARIRLRDFMVFRFGGPPRYIEQRGHPRLRARHAPFPVDQAGRDRWVALMDAALAETALDSQAARILQEFFHNTATFLMNRDTPPGGAGFAQNPQFPVRES